MVQFTELFGSKKTISVLLHFLENPHQEYSQKEIADLVGLSKATAVQVFRILLDVGIVKKRVIGPTNLYKLQADNELITHLHAIKTYLEERNA